MYCEKCGYSNKDGAKFCAHCGAPLMAAASRQDSRSAESRPDEKKTRSAEEGREEQSRYSAEDIQEEQDQRKKQRRQKAQDAQEKPGNRKRPKRADKASGTVTSGTALSVVMVFAGVALGIFSVFLPAVSSTDSAGQNVQYNGFRIGRYLESLYEIRSGGSGDGSLTFMFTAASVIFIILCVLAAVLKIKKFRIRGAILSVIAAVLAVGMFVLIIAICGGVNGSVSDFESIQLSKLSPEYGAIAGVAGSIIAAIGSIRK